jgi:hypothetical protein
MKKSSLSTVHPMVVFWLGLLTGAVIVSLLFFYKAMVPADYESSLFRSYYSPYSSSETFKNYNKSFQRNYIGSPDGNIYGSGTLNIGSPDGN